MPEGPEIKVIAGELQELLAGGMVKEVEVMEEGYFTEEERVKLEELDRLARERELRLGSVNSKGKLIWFQFSAPTLGIPGLEFRYLANHLGMTGCWLEEKGEHSKLSLSVLTEAGQEARVYFDDYRKFGWITPVTSLRLQKLLEGLGVDVLSEEFTLEKFQEALAPLQKSRRMIGEVLLDQAVLSGIGNYLRADILWTARLNPRTQIRNLTEEEVELLYSSIREITTRSFEHSGTTLRSYRDLHLRRGEYEPLVYEKKRDPLGNPVEKMKLGGRTLHWVPKLQAPHQPPGAASEGS